MVVGHLYVRPSSHRLSRGNVTASNRACALPAGDRARTRRRLSSIAVRLIEDIVPSGGSHGEPEKRDPMFALIQQQALQMISTCTAEKSCLTRPLVIVDQTSPRAAKDAVTGLPNPRAQI